MVTEMSCVNWTFIPFLEFQVHQVLFFGLAAILKGPLKLVRLMFTFENFAVYSDRR